MNAPRIKEHTMFDSIRTLVIAAAGTAVVTAGLGAAAFATAGRSTTGGLVRQPRC